VKSTKTFWKLFFDYKKITKILITHDVDLIKKSDKVIAVVDGTVIVYNSPKDLFKDKKVIKKLRISSRGNYVD
jgi:energy-coupling factor transporter ATP-binding protein EcfA2